MVVANDITFNSGAFGPREDAAFRAATEFALEERLPLLYLAANSGARVGLANELKKCLQVCLLLILKFTCCRSSSTRLLQRSSNYSTRSHVCLSRSKRN